MTPSRLTHANLNANGYQSVPDASAQDEVRLFERLARRDSTAVAELYALYSGPIYSFALRALGSREDAEELLQDTFVRLWEKAREYDPALGRPFTWALLLARGLCFDRLRRAGRRARSLRTVSLSGAGISDDSSRAGIPQHAPGIFSKDELRRIVAALEMLPASDRRAVEMAVFLEYTGQEIANDLHEPLGTIKSRIRRGLSRLRQLLIRHD
jgi:RNA polymerase sigma-70 factor (ECF subfamily)